jgi:hypothetical protein
MVSGISHISHITFVATHTQRSRSIYFYDFGNHLFELRTGTLTKRLQRHQTKAL